MLKKILLALAGVALCAIGAVSMFLYMNHVRQQETALYTSQISSLQAQIDAIGPMVDVFTVVAEVKPGTQLTSDMLQSMRVPVSCTNDDFCLYMSDIVGAAVTTNEDGEKVPASGYYAKTTIHVGTPITKSLLMAEPLQNSTRELDINVTHWPVGLTVGDYVDIRMTYPEGEEFIVLSHKRVNEINNQTLKIMMNENEQAIWQSALFEFYIYGVSGSGKGVDLYASKYIEPGVQNPAVAFYSPSSNIMNVVRLNHNIEGWSRDQFPADMHYDADIRELQDSLLGSSYTFTDPSSGETRTVMPYWVSPETWPGLVTSGRTNLIGLINSDYEEWKATHDYTGQPDIEGSSNQPNSGSLITGGGVN